MPRRPHLLPQLARIPKRNTAFPSLVGHRASARCPFFIGGPQPNNVHVVRGHSREGKVEMAEEKEFEPTIEDFENWTEEKEQAEFERIADANKVMYVIGDNTLFVRTSAGNVYRLPITMPSSTFARSSRAARAAPMPSSASRPSRSRRWSRSSRYSARSWLRPRERPWGNSPLHRRAEGARGRREGRFRGKGMEPAGRPRKQAPLCGRDRAVRGALRRPGDLNGCARGRSQVSDQLRRHVHRGGADAEQVPISHPDRRGAVPSCLLQGLRR